MKLSTNQILQYLKIDQSGVWFCEGGVETIIIELMHTYGLVLAIERHGKTMVVTSKYCKPFGMQLKQALLHCRRAYTVIMITVLIRCHTQPTSNYQAADYEGEGVVEADPV